MYAEFHLRVITKGSAAKRVFFACTRLQQQNNGSINPLPPAYSSAIYCELLFLNMNIQLLPTLAFLTPQTTLFLFAIVVMMFGAKKLPELARGMGLAIKEFTKAKNDINDEIMREPAPTPPQPAKQIDAEVAKAPAPQAQTDTHV